MVEVSAIAAAPVGGDLPECASGIMPVPMRLEFRDAYQDAGITQAQAAEMLGLSRPHLANAL